MPQIWNICQLLYFEVAFLSLCAVQSHQIQSMQMCCKDSALQKHSQYRRPAYQKARWCKQFIVLVTVDRKCPTLFGKGFLHLKYMWIRQLVSNETWEWFILQHTHYQSEIYKEICIEIPNSRYIKLLVGLYL